MNNNLSHRTNDPIIRDELIRFLSKKYKYDNDTIVIEELGLDQGAIRADLAVINGHMHGYEIKSDLDSLKRLPLQQEMYNNIFDFVTVVTGISHLEEITNIVPEWWGISLVNFDGSLATIKSIREALQNQTVQPEFLVKLLWRSESVILLEKMELSRGFKSKPKYQLWERIVNNMSLDELKISVINIIKVRENWKFDLARNEYVY